jgi:hypothetical protein
MRKLRVIIVIGLNIAVFSGCLPDPDCSETATCPSAPGVDAEVDSIDSGADVSAGFEVDAGRDRGLNVDVVGERINDDGDASFGSSDASPGMVAVDSSGSSIAPVCRLGDVRSCPQYPFAPAIPDETSCRDGKSCSAPCKTGTEVCISGDAGMTLWSDCQGVTGPDLSDTCDIANDGNCNGVANEGCLCINGTTNTCGEALGAKGNCASGKTTCVGGMWNSCSIAPAASDDCAVPGDDSNCNGLTNETCPCAPGETGTCAAKLGAKGVCASGVATCNASGTGSSCSIAPRDKDTCDTGNDATCDGTPNQGCACINGSTSTCALALHLIGPCSQGTSTCTNGAWGACSVKPGVDTCDSGNDNNCDGVPNNPPGGCTCINGSTSICGSSLGALGLCAFGSTTCRSGAWGLCSVQPAMRDTCDPGNDANCNGKANENCSCINNQPTSCAPGFDCAGGTCVCNGPKTACSAGCVDLQADPKNCGACGHDCLGGSCVGGTCQPLLLGVAPNDAVRDLFVSESKVYVIALTTSQTARLWQLDPVAPSTPAAVVGTPTDSPVRCIMGGKAFWLRANPSLIFSCSLSNCAATTVPVVSDIPDFVPIGPVCDVANDELVWIVQSLANGLPPVSSTVYRASPTGVNVRPITSFIFDVDGADWRYSDESGHFVNGRADRVFFARDDSVSGISTLFYVSTTTPNGSRISVASIGGSLLSGGASVLANDDRVIASFLPSPLTEDSLVAPLPNGVISGGPPRFLLGGFSQGAMDQTYFYGAGSSDVTVIPSDAVIRCPLADCSRPTIFRGQVGPAYFTQDVNAIYWTSANPATPGQGFDVWKLAK